jgi:hypothetical protein
MEKTMSYWDLYDKQVKFASLIGKTLASVTVNEDQDEIRFVTNEGHTYLMYHSQSCCESVGIESITGDLTDLIGSPILKAEEATSDTRPESVPAPEWEPDSETWTFYKLATIKGYVDIRWHGASNGYYSESVDFAQMPAAESEA